MCDNNNYFWFLDKPEPPENLKVTEVRRDYAKLAWAAPESDGGAPIKNYVIEKRDTSKMAWISCGNVDGHTFDFKVRCYWQFSQIISFSICKYGRGFCK